MVTRAAVDDKGLFCFCQQAVSLQDNLVTLSFKTGSAVKFIISGLTSKKVQEPVDMASNNAM